MLYVEADRIRNCNDLNMLCSKTTRPQEEEGKQSLNLSEFAVIDYHLKFDQEHYTVILSYQTTFS